MVTSDTTTDKYSSTFKSQVLYDRFVKLNEQLLEKGVQLRELKRICKCDHFRDTDEHATYNVLFAFLYVVPILLSLLACYSIAYLDGAMKSALSNKCVIPNNYLIWEATRPETDCRICSNLTGVLILNNLTRNQFQPFAYSYAPMIVKGAASGWPAMKSFDFDYFKRLYRAIPEGYKSIEEECQFLNFKSDFANLEEVFSKSNDGGTNDFDNPWYIGWSNCHPEILGEMRKQFSKPHFLPEDAEHSHIDFVFMGYQQGAFKHLDYISRLMWQAQLKGRKMWRLTPPPDCEAVCSSMSFTVSPGDILLLDTRQWYHETRVYDGEFSITVSSEYG